MLEDSFKALSLGNSPVKRRLTRSMSDPDISPRRRISVQEHVDTPFPNHTLFRREFSCDELGVDPETSSVQFRRRVVSELYVNYLSPKATVFNDEFNVNVNYLKPKPSELDMPANSAETSSPSFPKRKRRYRPRAAFSGFKRPKVFQLSDSDQNSSVSGSGEADRGTTLYSLVRSICIYSLVAIISSLIGLYAYGRALEFSICHVHFNLSLVESALEQKVYGQDEGMHKLLENLKDIYTKPHGMRILVFTGATGVGKTYTASILEEVFPWSHNVHHFIMPLDSGESEKPFISYPTCGDHLLIIDDLKEDDLEIAIKTADFMNIVYANQTRIIVVYIFKFHQQLLGNVSDGEVTAKGQSVVAKLKEKGIVGELIHFKSLQKEEVMKCICHSLTNNWIPVKDEYVKMVLEQVDFEKEGCKRISSKIAVLHDLWAREA